MQFKRSGNVPQLPHYADYRDTYLRPDFRYRCAYCLVHEYYFLSGDGGEIDHHRPLNPPPKLKKDFSHLANDYRNLYWTCAKCNNIKGNTWPTDIEYALNQRFLDPCEEDHDDHWETASDGSLQPKTSIGLYTITKIRLNRSRLKEHRRHQMEIRQLAIQLEQMLSSLLPGSDRDELFRILNALRQQIDPPVVEPY